MPIRSLTAASRRMGDMPQRRTVLATALGFPGVAYAVVA